MSKMAEEQATVSSGNESENERNSSGNVTIIAETFSDITPSTTLSSVNSEISDQQLICKSPQSQKNKPKQNAVDTKKAVVEKGETHIEKMRSSPDSANYCKSVLNSIPSDVSIRDHSLRKQSKLILFLGVCQVLVGVGLVVAGGLVMVHGSALSRTGAGLWAGCMAIVTGILGVLAGINDSYGLYDRQTSRMGSLFLTLFLACSLIALAAGNLAAVLAGTGLLRDARRPEESLQQDELVHGYWPPIFSNIGLLLTSCLHCLLSLISVYHTAKRVCSCFIPKEPFNHNQFNPSYLNQQPYSVMTVSEKEPKETVKSNRKDLSKILENKLMDSVEFEGGIQNPDDNVRQVAREIQPGVGSYFGSSNSKDKLVCSWLGGQQTLPMKMQKVSKSNGVRKNKMKQAPVLLMPATAGNPMHMPLGVPMLGAPPLGYATLPLLPARPPLLHPHPHPVHVVYPRHAPGGYTPHPYPINDMVRIKRKRYPGSEERRRGEQLTRSLERIHRRRGDSHSSSRQRRHKLTEADVIRTYTGLDRTIAEQFIVACDENRHSQTGSPDHSTLSANTRHTHPRLSADSRRPPGHRNKTSVSSGCETASSGSNGRKY